MWSAATCEDDSLTKTQTNTEIASTLWSDGHHNKGQAGRHKIIERNHNQSKSVSSEWLSAHKPWGPVSWLEMSQAFASDLLKSKIRSAGLLVDADRVHLVVLRLAGHLLRLLASFPAWAKADEAAPVEWGRCARSHFPERVCRDNATMRSALLSAVTALAVNFTGTSAPNTQL